MSVASPSNAILTKKLSNFEFEFFANQTPKTTKMIKVIVSVFLLVNIGKLASSEMLN